MLQHHGGRLHVLLVSGCVLQRGPSQFRLLGMMLEWFCKQGLIVNAA
ncbi:hypothetical protein [Acetobacter okinawensis]|nr:hypothetical protein [Acetobacter okinawensis]